MKAKYKLFLLTIVAITLSNCCKDPIYPEGYTIFGRWNIVEVDSGFLPDFPGSPYYGYGAMPDTATILFNEDSTGRFVTPVRNWTGGVLDFEWSHNKINGELDFKFSNGETWAWLRLQVRDTLDFLFADYLGDHWVGKKRYYHFKVTRQLVGKYGI